MLVSYRQPKHQVNIKLLYFLIKRFLRLTINILEDSRFYFCCIDCAMTHLFDKVKSCIRKLVMEDNNFQLSHNNQVWHIRGLNVLLSSFVAASTNA